MRSEQWGEAQAHLGSARKSGANGGVTGEEWRSQGVKKAIRGVQRSPPAAMVAQYFAVPARQEHNKTWVSDRPLSLLPSSLPLSLLSRSLPRQ